MIHPIEPNPVPGDRAKLPPWLKRSGRRWQPGRFVRGDPEFLPIVKNRLSNHVESVDEHTSWV